MVFIRPVRCDDINIFQNTSYGAMSSEAVEKMLAESLSKGHDGRYFELFAVMDDDNCVGFVSLYETAPGEISCGPESSPNADGRDMVISR